MSTGTTADVDGAYRPAVRRERRAQRVRTRAELDLGGRLAGRDGRRADLGLPVEERHGAGGLRRGDGGRERELLAGLLAARDRERRGRRRRRRDRDVDHLHAGDGSAFWCWNTSSCPSAAPVPLCTGMAAPSAPSVENEPGDVVVEPERRVVRVHRERLGRVQDAGVGRRVVGVRSYTEIVGVDPAGMPAQSSPIGATRTLLSNTPDSMVAGEPVDELDVEVLAGVVVERRGDGDVGVVVVLLHDRLQVVRAVTVDVDVDDGDDVAAERGPLAVGRDADAEQARGRVAAGCGDRGCRRGPAHVPDVTGGGGRRRRDEPRDGPRAWGSWRRGSAAWSASTSHRTPHRDREIARSAVAAAASANATGEAVRSETSRGAACSGTRSSSSRRSGPGGPTPRRRTRAGRRPGRRPTSGRAARWSVAGSAVSVRVTTADFPGARVIDAGVAVMVAPPGRRRARHRGGVPLARRAEVLHRDGLLGDDRGGADRRRRPR